MSSKDPFLIRDKPQAGKDGVNLLRIINYCNNWSLLRSKAVGKFAASFVIFHCPQQKAIATNLLRKNKEFDATYEEITCSVFAWIRKETLR